jgi:hypothetical protein
VALKNCTVPELNISDSIQRHYSLKTRTEVLQRRHLE